jgi:hypothetical protein
MQRHGIMGGIWGKPPQLRWHLRRRSWEEWENYLHRMKNLALSLIFRKKKTADITHKALSGHTKAEKIGRQTANRPRWRAFLRLAGELARDYEASDPGCGISLQGWAARRLSEGHGYTSILRALGHARGKLRSHIERGWIPENGASWISGVATRTLEYDGLTTYIRWRERGRLRKRHGADAPTFKDKKPEPLTRLIEWDRKRESLREVKILPNGRRIEYDPALGYWIDLP